MKKTAASLSAFHSQIGLDHFFVGFSPEEIQDLKILAQLPSCSFSEVKSGRETWRGVSWTTTFGHYFEMIERDGAEDYELGICLSARSTQYFDIRKLPGYFPKIKFLKELRRLGKNRWYESVFSQSHKHRSIYVWAMHYYFCPREKKFVKPDLPSFVDRFTDLEIRVPRRFMEGLKGAIFWAPIEVSAKGKLIVLRMRLKDRSEFRIKATVDNSLELAEFVSLKGEASPFCGKLPKMRKFDLKRVGRKVVLKRK